MEQRKKLELYHRYLITNSLYNSSPIAVVIEEVTTTSYKYKIESGTSIWITKEGFDKSYSVIEDLGIASEFVKKSIEKEKEEVERIKTLKDWIDEIAKKEQDKREKEKKAEIDKYNKYKLPKQAPYWLSEVKPFDTIQYVDKDGVHHFIRF